MDYSNFSSAKIKFLADQAGLTIEEWKAQQDTAGKQDGSSGQTQPTDPPTKAAGDSSSADISLGSPVTIDDFFDENGEYLIEEDVATALNAKLAKYGVRVEAAVMGNDAVRLYSVEDPTKESVAYTYKGLLGDGKSKAELEKMVGYINRDMKFYADPDHLNKVKERSTELHNSYVESIKPTEKTEKEKIDGATDEKLDRFNQFKAVEDEGNTPLFDDAEDKADYESWRDSGILPEPRENEIKAWDENRKREEAHEKSNDFSWNLSQSERDDLFVLEQARVEDIAAKAKSWPIALKAYQDAKAQLEIDIENYNKGEYNEAEYNRITDIQKSLILQYRDLVETANVIDETTIAPSGLEQLSAYYSMGAGMGVTFRSLGVGILRGLATMASSESAAAHAETELLMGDDPGNIDAANEVWLGKVEETEAIFDEKFMDLNLGLEKEQALLAERPEFADVKDLKTASRWAGGVVSSGLPSMVMSRAGVASMPLYYLSGSGTKSLEIAKEQYYAADRLAKNAEILEKGGYEVNGEFVALTEFDIAKLEAQNAQDQKLLSLSYTDKRTAAELSGIAEVAFEGFFDKLLTDGMLRGLKDTPIDDIKGAVKGMLKGGLKNIPAEGGSEGATQFANNVIDLLILDKDVNLFDGVTEATAGGALMGAGFSSVPALKGFNDAIVNELATRKEKAERQKIADEIAKLTDMSELDPLDPKRRRKKQSKEVEELIAKLTEEDAEIVRNISRRLGTDISLADAKEIGEINREMRAIDRQMIGIANSNQTNKQKTEAAKMLRSRYDALANKREDLLTDNARSKAAEKHNAGLKVNFDATAGYQEYTARFALDHFMQRKSQFDGQTETARQKAYADAKKELEAEGNEFTAQDVKTRAFENFVVEKNTKDLMTGYENVKNFIEKNNLGDELSIAALKNEAEARKWISENVALKDQADAFSRLEKGQLSGINADNGAFAVYMPVAAKEGKVGVFAHELLHTVAKSKLRSGQKELNRAGEKLMQYLEESHPELAEKVNLATQKYKEDQREEYYEEMMNALSDAIAEGFEYSETFLQSVRRFVNTALKKTDLTLDSSGESIFYFIRDFNKEAHFGGRAMPRFKRKFSAMTDDEGDSKFSISAEAERAKAVMDKVSENMDYFDPNSPLIARVLPGMIRAQLQPLLNKGLKLDVEEATSDVILRLYSGNDIGKFDGRGSLYGYVNGRIGFRIKDMLKNSEGIVEDFNQSDVEDLKGAAADVTTMEQIEARTEAERPEYRNLIERRVVTEETMATIKGKIPRVVGTLKNRIDEKVSKNKTVTPLINELRLALGKQIDIDLKTEMGGKKDGQLRKWLTSNKKALLENMTTTYLMQAMPIAIQKKVNGVWTSDWQGKKIDRETTSTDSAGRTSGAEMVRRLPQASLKIDDKTFLSYILEESGNPIRGKKESWAKAIAEELAFDIIAQDMQNPDSEIYRAFTANQERLGVEESFNYTSTLRVQAERGNVKYQLSAGQQIEAAMALDLAIQLRSKGNDVEYQALLDDIEENYGTDVVDDFKNFVDGAVGLGRGKFKTTLRDIAVEVDAKNGNDKFSELLDTFNNLELGKDKPGFRRTAEIAHNFNNKLLDKLHPAIAALIGGTDMFGYSPKFIDNNSDLGQEFNTKFAKKKNSKAAKTSRPSDLTFNIEDVHFLNDNSKIVKYIWAQKAKNITAQEKYNNIRETYGDQIDALNAANAAFADYLLGKMYEVAMESDEMALGFLLLLSNQSSIRAVLSDAASLTDIELYDGSEAPYLDADGNGVWSVSKDDIMSGKFTDNAGNPILQESTEYISKTGSKLSPVKMAKPKLEHAWPLVKQMTSIAGAFGRSAYADDTGAVSGYNKALFKYATRKLTGDFTLQVMSTLSSSIMDRKYGTTSEAGDLRMVSLPGAQQDALVDIRTGEKSIVRAAKKIAEAVPEIAFNNKVLVRQAIAQKASTKYSMARPQAIFMVGGPGAGKSSVVNGLDLINMGYRLVNQDPMLEKMIAEAGLPTDEKTYDKEQRSIRAKLGWKARKATEEYMNSLRDSKESMIVDGTGASYNATTKKMKALEDAGFEIHMIHVNTSKNVAVQRNRARSERSLADFIVTKTWDSVQESVAKYKEDYPTRFYEVNTDNLQQGGKLPQEFVDQVNNGLQESKTKYSLALSQEFNEMIERTKGVSANKVYSRVQAAMMGEKKGKYRVFVPASAEDFRGLTSYTFAGKGKQGEADQRWIEEKLIDPYVRGVAQIDAVKQQIRREYRVVAKEHKQYFKMLGKKISNTDFTYDQALRVYMWTQQGIEIPGMDIDDIKFLINEINQFPGLIDLGNAMQVISRQDTWVEPGPHWMSNTLISDLNSMTEKVGRQKYLQEFLDNADVIFSPENLNKIEAVYGTRHREAIEDALYSMKHGRNRPSGMNKQMNQWLNWVNNSTGAIMFFNIRSAVLQTLSATNFINWSDNNPAKAAAAFANQPQFWKDFAYIFNSDKLKQRRSGLQTDVNEAEIANMADGAQNKASAVIAYLLKIGFTPTQIADSFAIAMGGASFYRNRVNTYLKQGMSQADAEAQAWEDFGKTADEAQQSSDPYLVSQEQRSPLGRLVLAFQNTPMQYTRLMKKSMQDLANGRGDAKTHISKIMYYGAVQNFVFSALQSALFAMVPGFDDDDELDEKEAEKRQRQDDAKILRIVNSMTDSILKGSGVKGAVLATIKNTITEYFKQEEKGFTADHTYTILQALSLSPPIGSKARKIYSAIQTNKFDKDVLEARGFQVMADGRINLSPAYSAIGSLASGVANVPMDRIVDIINSYSEALDARNSAWQRIALALGWKTWDVGAKNEEHDLIKANAKERRKEEGKAKAKKTREENKKKKAQEQKDAQARAKEKWLREHGKK